MVAPNHVSFYETAALIVGDIHPALVAKIETKNIPVVGKLTVALQSIYVDRFANKETRDQNVQQITDHQKHIVEDKQQFNPLCIFPEGCTTNGRGL